MLKNFDGVHFWIPTSNGNRIDSMFYPCTTDETVSIENPKGEYLSKPTVIFCGPNALLY